MSRELKILPEVKAMAANPDVAATRKAYYQRIAPYNMTPLWEVLHGLITPEPRSQCQPALWCYNDIRQSILEAGELITAKEAERRVLVLENPGMPGESKITTSLYAGLQLIMPGEVAPAHRHTQSALRFVVEGNGAYTSVDGEKTLMHEGDFVITPSWTWHDHGNESEQPMIWLDGLDIPITQTLDVSFVEGHNEDTQPLHKPLGDALARYGSGLLPIDHPTYASTSPVFNYPYERTREALEQMRKAEEWDSHHGLKLKYVNPVTGDYAIATMATFMQLLPKNFQTAPYRSTDATVYSVVEGSGKTVIGETTFEWGKRDTFVIPSWYQHYHKASYDAVLFSFSDRPVQQKLGLWREQRN